MNKRLLQIILFFSLFIALSYFGFLMMGYFSARDYHESKEQLFVGEPDKMWDLLSNIDNIPKRRKDVLEIKRLSNNRYDLESWLEVTPTGGELRFDAIEKVPKTRFVVQLQGSNFDMTGKWTYELLDTDRPGVFKLRITEDSYVDNAMVRAIMKVTGRDATLRQEMESLRGMFDD